MNFATDSTAHTDGSWPHAQADLAQCRAALREGSYTFYAASLVLPAAVRAPASALYAFCRAADDEVDHGVDRHAAVARLRERLDLAYAPTRPGAAARVQDRALHAVVHRHGIPRLLPEALLQGFEWDAQGRRYESLDDLHDYAARVAGTVGAMMALIMGARGRQALARACDLGVAMQLSNIARDVGEDARMGRIYLPLRWLREAGVQPDAWLREPRFTPAIAQVVGRLLDAAQQLYDRVDAGVAELPLACRPGINAARYLYASIGHEVARGGMDSITRRAVVPRHRKAWLLVRALAHLAPGRAALDEPCLPANRFLVEAAVLARPAVTLARPAASARQARGLAALEVARRIDERAAWVIDLFDRLERRDRELVMALPQRREMRRAG